VSYIYTIVDNIQCTLYYVTDHCVKGSKNLNATKRPLQKSVFVCLCQWCGQTFSHVQAVMDKPLNHAIHTNAHDHFHNEH